MPVGEMLRRMTSAELTEWMAWFDYRANPPKQPQTAAQIRDEVARMARPKKKAR